ncbi:MAG: tetratricopeptide repeat protein [Deltaproteobacteria bacterium]|nr:tetratricopeptide repeat protein [Candidatus Zymogenaceae bacterium]
MRSFRLFLLVSVIVLTAGFGVLECRAQEYSADEYKSDIRAALGADDYSKAIEICENAIKEYPNDANFWYYEGFALAEKGSFKEAEKAYDAANKLKPFRFKKVEFKTEKAQELFYLGKDVRSSNPDLSIEYFLKCNELEPDNPAGLHEIAIAYYIYKKDDLKSIGYLRKAISLDPDGMSLINIPFLYHATRDYKRALFYFNLTHRLAPTFNTKIVEEGIVDCEENLGL